MDRWNASSLNKMPKLSIKAASSWWGSRGPYIYYISGSFDMVGYFLANPKAIENRNCWRNFTNGISFREAQQQDAVLRPLIVQTAIHYGRHLLPTNLWRFHKNNIYSGLMGAIQKNRYIFLSPMDRNQRKISNHLLNFMSIKLKGNIKARIIIINIRNIFLPKIIKIINDD